MFANPNVSVFVAAIMTSMTCLFLIISAWSIGKAKPLAGALSTPDVWSPVEASRVSLDKRGNGYIVDYCDDDWAIQPPQYFYAKCENATGGRSYMYIDLDQCYTVGDDGQLSVDNWRK
jgi:hypothetical protein